MSAFVYKKWQVRFHSKGYPQSGNYYPYCLKVNGVAMYFGSKISVQKYIDDNLGWKK